MATDAPRHAVLIVLAWNRWPLTKRCLESLRTTDLADAEVLVVDNGSIDETPERLAELDWIRTLTLPENTGFVRGNNAGIEAAADFAPGADVVLLNNDLEIRQHDWLQRLRATAHSSERVGVVGCRLVDGDGLLLHAGTYMPIETMWGQQIGAGEKDVGQYSWDHAVEGIVFACAYLRHETLQAIGGLSRDYQSYFEDTDYCLRARDAGFETWLCGGATLRHDEHGSTEGEDGFRTSTFQTSREVFRRRWADRLAARYHRDVHWQSIMNFPTGYAMSSREILLALDRRGVRPTYRYVYGPRTVFPVPEKKKFDEYRLNVFAGRRAPRRPPVSVVYGQANVFHRNRGKYKIGFTMLEVDGFPDDWVREANRMDEVWVPSEFNRRGLLECGVRKPIHIVPLGFDPHYFHPGIEAYPNPHGEFVFLSIFEWGERKCPEALLRAFSDAFCADEPVRLVCKVMNRDMDLSIKQEIRNLRLRPGGGRMSFLFNHEFPRHQLGALYRSADCYVSPSRGEGWNMPLMEAMACGLPVIGTDWGAHREFLGNDISYPLRVRGTIPAVAKCPYYRGHSWADPDEDHLRHLLREVYEQPQVAKRKGDAAAREMARAWTWDHTAAIIEERLRAV